MTTLLIQLIQGFQNTFTLIRFPLSLPMSFLHSSHSTLYFILFPFYSCLYLIMIDTLHFYTPYRSLEYPRVSLSNQCYCTSLIHIPTSGKSTTLRTTDVTQLLSTYCHVFVVTFTLQTNVSPSSKWSPFQGHKDDLWMEFRE